jgi:hypothetical protein
MSEPESAAASSSVYTQPWAIRFGTAVIVAFTLIVGLAFLDSGKRKELEASTETTAVGDTAFFKLPDPARAPEPAAVLDGRPLIFAGSKPLDLRDTHTRRVGRDAERGLSIYELADSALPAEKTRVGNGRVLLLKVAVNQYVTAAPAPQ